MVWFPKTSLRSHVDGELPRTLGQHDVERAVHQQTLLLSANTWMERAIKTNQNENVLEVTAADHPASIQRVIAAAGFFPIAHWGPRYANDSGHVNLCSKMHTVFSMQETRPMPWNQILFLDKVPDLFVAGLFTQKLHGFLRNQVGDRVVQMSGSANVS